MFNHLLSVQRINVRLLLPSELQGTSVLDWPEQTSEGEGGRRKELWGGHWPSFLHSILRVIENCQCGFFSEQHKAVLAFTGIYPGDRTSGRYVSMLVSMSHFSKPFEVFYFGHIKSQSSYSGLKYSVTSAGVSTSLWPELSHCFPVLACAEKLCFWLLPLSVDKKCCFHEIPGFPKGYIIILSIDSSHRKNELNLLFFFSRLHPSA